MLAIPGIAILAEMASTTRSAATTTLARTVGSPLNSVWDVVDARLTDWLATADIGTAFSRARVSTGVAASPPRLRLRTTVAVVADLPIAGGRTDERDRRRGLARRNSWDRQWRLRRRRYPASDAAPKPRAIAPDPSHPIRAGWRRGARRRPSLPRPGRMTHPQCLVAFKYWKNMSPRCGAQTGGQVSRHHFMGRKSLCNLAVATLPCRMTAVGNSPAQVGLPRGGRVGVRSRQGGSGGIYCDGRR